MGEIYYHHRLRSRCEVRRTHRHSCWCRNHQTQGTWLDHPGVRTSSSTAGSLCSCILHVTLSHMSRRIGGATKYQIGCSWHCSHHIYPSQEITGAVDCPSLIHVLSNEIVISVARTRDQDWVRLRGRAEQAVHGDRVCLAFFTCQGIPWPWISVQST